MCIEQNIKVNIDNINRFGIIKRTLLTLEVRTMENYCQGIKISVIHGLRMDG